MAKAEKKPEHLCKPSPQDKPVEWGNSEGIAAPSETALPFMESEGFTEAMGVDREEDPAFDNSSRKSGDGKGGDKRR